MTDSAPLLDVRDVSLAFDGVHALDCVSFAVNYAEVCAIIGPNGAGKSSLLNIISGLYTAATGSVRFEGGELRDAKDLSAFGITRTFQTPALFRGMTVIENVELGNDFRGRATFLEQALRVGRAPREERHSRRAANEILSATRSCRTSGRRRAVACPMACRSASSWRGLSHPGRSCFCSTSRWPA